MKRPLALITSVLLILPTLAFSEELTGAGASPALAPPELGGLQTTFSIIKLLAAFMVVAGVMALVFKLMRKFGPPSTGKSGLIKVLDTRMIAQKKYISVVRIADQDLAVAISENTISLLCTLNNTDTEQKTPGANQEFSNVMETATAQELTQP